MSICHDRKHLVRVSENDEAATQYLSNRNKDTCLIGCKLTESYLTEVSKSIILHKEEQIKCLINRRHTMKVANKNWLIVFSLFFSLLLAGNASASVPDTPVGKVTIESKTVAVGVGYSWGEGVLTYQGEEYRFKIKGMSVVDAGISSITAQGDVYNLEDVSEFSGTFAAAEVGIAVGGGTGAQIMKNQNGVVLKLNSKKAGVQFKLAPEGLKVEME